MKVPNKKVPNKNRWKATASSGDPGRAIDDRYATTWKSKPAKKPWLKIDLGKAATLAGLEVYWGQDAPVTYAFKSSLDGKRWTHLCRTRHGEGGQDVFAFPPVEARFVRWTCDDPQAERGKEIVEINLYGPADAASVKEEGRVAALGHAPVKLPKGESITVDFGYVRSPLGAFIEWGAAYGTDFSVYLSDDGKSFREVGRILTGNGGSDSFWWRSTTSRYFRLTVHETSAPEGAIVNELKLRILNKDRMPIGQLERAAAAGRGDLYPQSLLGRQVYWTALGKYDEAEQALLDEYGNLEPQRGSPQITPLIRLGHALHGAPASASISQSLAEGSLPIPTVDWAAGHIEVRVTALCHAGLAVAEHRVTNKGAATRKGALVLAVRPVQIDPYWQHGGHAAINSVAIDGQEVNVNDRLYATFSLAPDSVAVADFDNGDVIRLIDKGPKKTAPSLRSELWPPQRRLRIRLLARAGRKLRRRRVGADAGRRQAADGGAVRRLARDRRAGLAGEDRPAKDHGRRPRGERHSRGADGAHPRQFHGTRLQARSPQLRPHLDSRRLRGGAGPAVGRPRRRGQGLCRLVREAHLRERHGSADPQRGRHGQPGLRQRHRVRRAGRVRGNRRRRLSHQPRPRISSARFSSPSSARRGSSRSFAREPTPSTAPRRASTAFLRHPSATRATASRRTAIGTTISP